MNNTTSTTPRTDAVAKMYAQGVDSHYDGQQFCKLARQLETELQAAQQEIAELKRDKERLDWFNADLTRLGTVWYNHDSTDIRQAIDNAMKEDK